MTKHRLLPLGLAAFAAVVLTAVGFVATGAAAPQAAFKAGLVSDVGRFNDKGFNQTQLVGMKRAAKAAEVPVPRGRVAVGERLPAEHGFAGAAGVQHRHLGRLPADRRDRGRSRISSRTRSSRSRTTPWRPSRKPHSNIEGLTYATQQNSYLVGCLAAKVAAREGRKNIGVVGGIKIPPVDTFLAGYRAGAAKCVPGTTVQIGYSQNFTDPGPLQGRSPEPARRRRTRDLRRCGPVRYRRSRRGEGGRPLGRRRGHGPVVPRQLHPHQRGEESRHRHLPGGEGSESRGRATGVAKTSSSI